MKYIILLVCFSSAICLTSQAFVAPVCASPFVQDKDRDDLEKMILKKIEERKKEMEAEKSKKGTSSKPSSNKSYSSKSSPSSKRSATPASSSRIRSTKSESPRRATGTPRKATEAGSSTVVAPPRVRPTAKEPEFTQPTQLSIPSPSAIDPNVKITFSFQDEEWKEILEWFANEIGFGLFYGQTGPPAGTHSYVDQNSYTLIEALDKLNSWLGIMQPSHVLVRNGNLLILINESDMIPESILPFVTPDQLPEYSKYEVVRCKFDLEKLNGNVLATQLRENISQVHLDGFSYVEAANHLIVRERVRVLREINAIIEEARRDSNPRKITTFEFQHADPETALITVREVLGIPEDVNETEDGSLRFALSPANQKVYLTGTADLIQRFEDIAEMLDAPVGDGDLLPDKPYTRKHSVSGDVEVVFQIVQTFLDGELNVRMDQDSVTGDLYLSATKDVHDRVTELLNTIGGGTDTFDIVPVTNMRPNEVVDTIEELLGIDTFSDEVSNGPRLIADGDNDRVLIYGTPQQRVEVRRMIEQLDQEETGQAKVRRRIRVIPMSQRDAENVINYMEIDGIMDSIGRKNRLNIIMPKDRNRFLDRNRPSQQPKDTGAESSQDRNGDRSSNREFRTRIGQNSSKSLIYPTLKDTETQPAYYASTFVQEPASDDRLGTVSGGGQEGGSLEPQEFNVPGADVQIRLVEQGLVIESDDLDAADDLEDLFDEIIGGTGQPEFPTFIGVEFRDANEVKALLDHILGLASSSGGGGGGGGLMNLVGGAMSNAMGGAAGDALGGLLGGGGGGFSESTEGAVELEGEDVSITVDGRTNSLIVTGATANDLDFIVELVEVVDVDSPPHRPTLLGQTYVIPVRNRDPMYVKEKVEMQLSAYFRNAQSNAGGNNQQNPEQAIQRAVLQQLQGSGGGRRGRGGNAAAGGANNANSEAPKATLGIDEENSTLLLTGPKSIYEEVQDLVEKLDFKQRTYIDHARVDYLSSDALAKYLKAVFGDKIEIVADEEDEETLGGTGGSTRTATRGGTNRGATGGRNAGGGRTPSPAELNRTIRDAVRNGGGGGGRNIQRGGRGR